MGGAVFPPCCLTQDQTMVEEMKIMATSFKRSYARTAALNALDPATTNPRLTKVCLVKAIKTTAFFSPVVMYGCEGWTINKAECRSIDAFELWCWRRVLSPLDCKEIQPVNPKGYQS